MIYYLRYFVPSECLKQRVKLYLEEKGREGAQLIRTEDIAKNTENGAVEFIFLKGKVSDDIVEGLQERGVQVTIIENQIKKILCQ